MNKEKTIAEGWNDYFKQKETVLTFFKEAMCIDGEAEFVEGTIKHDCCIKLTDSKRGVFYIVSGKEIT